MKGSVSQSGIYCQAIENQWYLKPDKILLKDYKTNSV